MTLYRLFGVMSFTVAVTTSCSSLADPAPTVRLTVSSVRVDATGGALQYHFLIVNEGSAPVYLPACNQGVRPDFDIATTPPDHSSGSICLAIFESSPRRLPGGASLSGDGIVLRRAGVVYTPVLPYALSRNGRYTQASRASAFTAP